MSPFGICLTIRPFFIVEVMHGPIVASATSLSVKRESRKLGGPSSKTGSGCFSSTTSAAWPLAPFFAAAAAAALAASSLAASSSALGVGGLTSMSFCAFL